MERNDMARIRQFAKDMGLSYNKAKNLVNKGRKLNDKGSSVLEKHKMAIKVLPKKKKKPSKKYNPDMDKELDKIIRDAEEDTPGIMEATGVKKAYGGANKVKPVYAKEGKFKKPKDYDQSVVDIALKLEKDGKLVSAVEKVRERQKKTAKLLQDPDSQSVRRQMIKKSKGGGKVTNFGSKKDINIGKVKTNQFKNIANAAAAGKITPEEALKKTQALVRKKYGGGLKDVPPGNKGKGLSKLPAPVRNKMGFKKKGGAMKMRGGGLAIQGLGFRGVR
jgi:hypothetical protein